MKELTTKEINDVCLTIYNQALLEQSFFVPHIHFLYHYGVRIGEVIYRHITHIDDSNFLNIFPQKKNNLRKFKIKSNQTSIMLEQLHNKEDSYLHSYKNLQREIKKLNPYGNLRNGKKNIGAHVFRHNYIRNLLDSGNTPEEINNLMGYTTQKVEDTYLRGRIYY